jgi:hypothetical protein
MQSTNWRNVSVLDYVAHVLRAESTLTESDKNDLRTSLKLDNITELSKNRVDTMCTSLKACALWSEKPCKLTAEAISWLREKQSELDNAVAEADVEETAPFTMQFKNCSNTTERGQLALEVKHYKFEDMFKQSRSGPLMPLVQQFARCAAAHANAGMDCATLLEGGLGSTDDGIPAEVTDAVDAFFVQFMVCSYNSCLLLSSAICRSFHLKYIELHSTNTQLFHSHRVITIVHGRKMPLGLRVCRKNTSSQTRPYPPIRM